VTPRPHRQEQKAIRQKEAVQEKENPGRPPRHPASSPSSIGDYLVRWRSTACGRPVACFYEKWHVGT